MLDKEEAEETMEAEEDVKLGVYPMLLKIIERMMVWVELNFLFLNSALIIMMWKSTSGGILN